MFLSLKIGGRVGTREWDREIEECAHALAEEPSLWILLLLYPYKISLMVKSFEAGPKYLTALNWFNLAVSQQELKL